MRILESLGASLDGSREAMMADGQAVFTELIQQVTDLLEDHGIAESRIDKIIALILEDFEDNICAAQERVAEGR